jgi:hypothetical protein
MFFFSMFIWVNLGVLLDLYWCTFRILRFGGTLGSFTPSKMFLIKFFFFNVNLSEFEGPVLVYMVYLCNFKVWGGAVFVFIIWYPPPMTWCVSD